MCSHSYQAVENWLRQEVLPGRAARLAHVHQYGKTDQVAPGGPRYRYSARILLGLTQAEKDMIREKVVAYCLN